MSFAKNCKQIFDDEVQTRILFQLYLSMFLPRKAMEAELALLEKTASVADANMVSSHCTKWMIGANGHALTNETFSLKPRAIKFFFTRSP